MEVKHVTASIGSAFFPQDRSILDSLAPLLDAADSRHVRGQERRSTTVIILSPCGGPPGRPAHALEQRLERAFEARDFRLFYHPLVAWLTQSDRAEALLRWNEQHRAGRYPRRTIFIRRGGKRAHRQDRRLGPAKNKKKEQSYCRSCADRAEEPPVAINVVGVQLPRHLGVYENVLARARVGMLTRDLEIEVHDLRSG